MLRHCRSSDCKGTAHTNTREDMQQLLLLSCQVAHLQTLVLWTQLQMRDVLDCRTVLNSQVVLCATVVSSLGPLLSMSATPPIIWRVPGSENARVMGTGVVLFHSVLLVSHLLPLLSRTVHCSILYTQFLACCSHCYNSDRITNW